MYMIFLVSYKPYADKQRNFNEIRNEIVVMIYIMLTRIYTPWETDVDFRQKASFVQIGLISLNFLVSSVYIIKRSIAEVKKAVILHK